MPVSSWSTTAASNGATLGVDIAENCDAANMNNMGREIMAQAKTKFDAIDVTLAGLSSDPTLTALGALTTAANEMIYATGVDTFAMTTLSTFARTLIDDGDAETARGTLGALGLTLTGDSTSGTAAFKSGATTLLMIQWKDFTATANTTTSVNFPTAFSSWSRAWVNGAQTDTDAEQNNCCVTTNGTASAIVTTAYSASGNTSATIFAIGV